MQYVGSTMIGEATLKIKQRVLMVNHQNQYKSYKSSEFAESRKSQRSTALSRRKILPSMSYLRKV